MANDFSSSCARATKPKRAHVVWIDLERLAAHHHGFFEAVIRGGQLGGHAVRAAEPGIDLQRRGGLLLEVGLTAFDVGNGAAPGKGIKAKRIDRLRFRNRRLGGFAIALVELELRLEQVRLDHVRIERQRLLDSLLGSRRVHINERPCHADERRNPLGVGGEGVLK